MIEPKLLAELLLAGSGGMALAYLGARQGLRTPKGRRGWHNVRPGSVHWLGFLGSGGAIAALLHYLTRTAPGPVAPHPDAPLIWSAIVALAAVMALCGVRMRQIKRLGLRWRGSHLSWLGPEGNRLTCPLAEVRKVDRRLIARARIVLPEGQVLRVDPLATGVSGLWKRIAKLKARQEG